MSVKPGGILISQQYREVICIYLCSNLFIIRIIIIIIITMQTSMHDLTAHRFVSIWRPAWTFLLTFPPIFVASKAGDLAKDLWMFQVLTKPAIFLRGVQPLLSVIVEAKTDISSQNRDVSPTLTERFLYLNQTRGWKLTTDFQHNTEDPQRTFNRKQRGKCVGTM